MASPAYHPTVAVFSGGGTGGHLYPALALADALARVRPEVGTFFVGARRGLEARIVPERGMDHVLLPVRGFKRGRILENAAVLWALLRSLVITGQLFSQLRPKVVVVTGGYACGPAGVMAGVMGIPLVLQEQNARPGFTTRVLSRWSSQIHLAFPEAREFLPSRARDRATLSGNPIRPVEQVDVVEARARFGVEEGATVVLVVGGSQGSEALNRTMLEAVRGVATGGLERPEDVVLLWATGPANFVEVQTRLADLGHPRWIRILPYIQEMAEALSLASLAVSRAGAMTTSEFLAWGIPAVLIPLPSAAADHQSRNAESLADAGAAVHMAEKGLSGVALWDEVVSLVTEPGALRDMGERALRAGRPEAAGEIARALADLIEPNGAGLSREPGRVSA